MEPGHHLKQRRRRCGLTLLETMVAAATSFHILTTDGIRGRDSLRRGDG